MKITAAVGVVLILPVIALAFTTTPVSVVPTAEQTLSTYDAGSIPVVSDNVLTRSEVNAQPVPSFGQVVRLVAASRL